jgi:hypothetical protein
MPIFLAREPAASKKAIPKRKDGLLHFMYWAKPVLMILYLVAYVIFLLVKCLLFLFCYMTVILGCHIALLLANLMIFVVDFGSFRLAHLSVLDLLVGPGILIVQPAVHLFAAGMVLCPLAILRKG